MWVALQFRAKRPREPFLRGITVCGGRRVEQTGGDEGRRRGAETTLGGLRRQEKKGAGSETDRKQEMKMYRL